MVTKRRWALLVAALACAVVGCIAAYVRVELADPDRFADRAVDAVRSPAVSSVIAERLAVDVLERQSPDLVATRPLVLTAVEAVLETDGFERIARRAFVTAHEVLLEGDDDVTVELAQLRDVIVPALRSVSPELARRVPDDLGTDIPALRRSDAATATVRAAHRAQLVAWPALALALVGLAALVLTASDRRRAVGAVGIGMAVAGVVGVLALGALEERLVADAGRVGALSEDDGRAAARAVWDAMAGDLQRLLVLFSGLGVALWASVRLAGLRFDRHAAARGVADAVAGDALPAPARVLRGAGLAVVGAVLLLRLDPLFGVLVAAGGAVVALVGLTELVSSLRTAAESVEDHVVRRPRRARIAWVGAGAVVVVAVAAAALIARSGGAPAPLRDDEISGCNGLAALCDRRLDEVVFAGTHNSMSAAERGWLFANQTRPIPRQLDDGIRLLMLDPHYGVVNRQGRIRTDLTAEGTTRNRVAGQLGFDALAATERLAGRIGLVPEEGERGIYLCHTLCELGAEPLDATLRELRGWLEANPAEVVVVMLESSVAADEVEAAFEDAGLEDHLAELDRSQPLPTLRELITSGHRLIVFDERDGGPAPWHQPGFLFAQDTSIKAFTRDPGSCVPRRGTPDNQLLIANHWVDRFPPSVSAARDVNARDALLAQVRRCRERLGRTPNAIAVDFYERGDLLETVRELNRSSAAGTP